jgi:hypothetical protein
MTTTSRLTPGSNQTDLDFEPAFASVHLRVNDFNPSEPLIPALERWHYNLLQAGCVWREFWNETPKLGTAWQFLPSSRTTQPFLQ